METDIQGSGGVDTAPGPSGESPERRRRLRRILPLLALLALIGLSLLLIEAVDTIQDELLGARAAMERGRDALLSGDADAGRWFDEAEARFDDAEGQASGPLLRPIGWLPFVGRTVDTVGAIAVSGGTAAEGGGVLADALADLPGGVEALAPVAGRIPVELLPPLADAATEADSLFAGAVGRLADSPSTLLVGPVADAREEAYEQLHDLARTIHSTAGVLNRLPAFLGAEGSRRYFFGAANPAELRGTGGLIGAYAILTIDDGRFRLSPFVEIHGLPTTSLDRLPSPNEDYADNYDQFRRGGRFWTAINVMPDFPSVAQAILTAYEAGTDDALDGVIVVDPHALRVLLEASGPVRLPGYEIEVTADNVVAFTTNEAFSLLTDPASRKRILGDVARAAFARFMRGSPSLDDLEAVLEAAAERHIQVYSTDAVMQEALESTSAGGTLLPPDAEANVLSVVVNSAAGSKVDFYQERRIDHSIVLHEDGSATATTQVDLYNDAPRSGQPPYVIGPFMFVEEPGGSIALTHVYCGTECVPGQAHLDGAPVDAFTKVDLGVRYVQHYYPIASKEHRSFDISWLEPTAWEGNSSGGTYRMTFANQVTIRPVEVEIRISPPPGMRIVDASETMRVVDGMAVYEGVPGSRLDLEVEFAPSLPVRWWRNVVRFLTAPVVEL